MEGKGELHMHPTRGCRRGGPLCGSLKGECLYGWLWARTGFLLLVLDWNEGQKLRKLSVINQVLVILGHLLQELFLGFLKWSPKMSVRVSFLKMVWPFLFCNQIYLRL